MKERPILFSTPMVQAIVQGRKTKTRRTIKPQPELSERVGFCYKGRAYGIGFSERETKRNFVSCCCPYGQIGDVLWVRETWRGIAQDFGPYRYEYKATESINLIDKWKPSIFMPREACRLRLEITDIRVERLQEISEEDAIKEGVWLNGADYSDPNQSLRPTSCFKSLWQSINGPESWHLNPWVWAITFRKL